VSRAAAPCPEALAVDPLFGICRTHSYTVHRIGILSEFRRVGGPMWRKLGPVILVAACVLFTPLTAHAQSAFSGVVRDASGAVLPGGTVEATSPVLIEEL